MRSKTLYFNSTLFKKNLFRFWPLWGGVSLLGALVPLTLLMQVIQNGFRWCPKPLEMTRMYYSTLQIAVPVLSLLYAVLCALAVWHYLYNHRSVSLFHALPITRKGLFFTNFLSGLAMMLIPYAVAGVLTVCISLAFGFFEPVGILMTVLGVLGLSFFYFSTATFVVFVTGNPFAFAAFYFIFHFLAAAAEWLAAELMTLFYFGVSTAYTGVVQFLSPTIYLMESLNVRSNYAEIVTPDGWIDTHELDTVTMEHSWLIAVYALAGVAFLGCAWLLYQRRRSESAGDVVAVGWMKPIFRYGVALCAALSGGALLYTLLWDGFQKRATADLLPMAVCMALVGLVGYYIASMLLAKSIKVFRGSGRGALATVVAAAAICTVIALDPAGLTRMVPDLETLSGVSIDIMGPNGHCSALLEKPEDMQKVLELHSSIVAEQDSLNVRTPGYAAALEESSYAYVNIYYYILNGGRPVARSYGLRFQPAALDQGGAVSQLSALVCDSAVQESNIFSQFIYDNERITDLRLTGGYIGTLYRPETQELVNLDLTLEQSRVLEAGIRRDIQAGHFGKTMFLADYTDYRNTAYSGDIQLYYTYTLLPNEYREGGTASGNVYLSISTYCTETLKALEEIGAVTDSLRLLTQMEYESIRSESNGYYDSPMDTPMAHDGYESESVYMGEVY